MRHFRMLTVRAALRAPVCVAATLALVSAAGCTVGQWTTLEERAVSVEIEHRGESGIDVLTENGAVSIAADSSTDRVTVSATVRAKTVERAEATQIVAERAENGTLTLRVVWPEGKREGSEGVSFDIVLPGAHGATVKTGNGRVTLDGLSGEAKIETSNGAVEVDRHTGPVNATTSNGRIEIADVDGAARLHTSNGRIVIERLLGSVTAQTSNGAIEIALEPGSEGTISARTSNGAITFEAPSSLGASLDLSTSNGKIVVNRAGETMEFKHSARVELNGGGPTCTLSTSNGRITVDVIDPNDADPDDDDND